MPWRAGCYLALPCLAGESWHEQQPRTQRRRGEWGEGVGGVWAQIKAKWQRSCCQENGSLILTTRYLILRLCLCTCSKLRLEVPSEAGTGVLPGLKPSAASWSVSCPQQELS